MNETPKSKQNADGGSMMRLVRILYVGNDAVGRRWAAEEESQKICPTAYGNHYPEHSFGRERWKVVDTKIIHANA